MSAVCSGVNVPGAVAGIVVWEDGSPVRAGGFYVEDAAFPGWLYVAGGEISEDGRFSAQLFQGRRYIVSAGTATSEDGDQLRTPRKAPVTEIVLTDQPGFIKLTIRE